MSRSGCPGVGSAFPVEPGDPHARASRVKVCWVLPALPERLVAVNVAQ